MYSFRNRDVILEGLIQYFTRMRGRNLAFGNGAFARVAKKVELEKKESPNPNEILFQRILNLLRTCKGFQTLPMEAIKLNIKSIGDEVLKIIDTDIC